MRKVRNQNSQLRDQWSVVSGQWSVVSGLVVSGLAALWSCCAFASATVSFNLVNFRSDPATNRLVIITPLQLTPATNQIASYDRLAFDSGSNGQFTVTNLIPGLYQVAIQAPPDLTTFAILAPTNGNASADTLIVAYPKTAARPQDYPYSAQASDARYAIAGGGGLAFIPQVGSENLTNWSDMTTADYSNTLAGAWAAADLIVATDSTNYVLGASNALYQSIQVVASSNGVVSFNERQGLVTLTSNDVITALGYAPGTGSGTGQTNWDYTAITNAPWVTNDQHRFYVPNNLYVAFTGEAGDTNLLIFQESALGIWAPNYSGNANWLTNLNASALASGTVPLDRLSGIRSNQLDAGTWLLATNQSGGGGTPVRAGTNVVIYDDTGTNVINAVPGGGGTATGLTPGAWLDNVSLFDSGVPSQRILITNGYFLDPAASNQTVLWFPPDTNDVSSRILWSQNNPRVHCGFHFWPNHYNSYPELIMGAVPGSLCFYYDWIQWGQPSHAGPTYEYWKHTLYGAQLDRTTGATNFNLWPGATWCFQALVRTNSGETDVKLAGSLGASSGQVKMPTMQFRPTSTNGSGAWIWMDDFDPMVRDRASVVTAWGTNTHYWFSDNTYTERFRITAGPDGGLSFNGTLTVNGAVGITTNYPMPNGDVMSISNGIVVFLGPLPPYVWDELATNYLGRIGTELTCELATNVNEFVIEAKGVLTNLAGFYLLCGTAASNTVNLVSSDYALTVVGEFGTNDASGVDNGGVTTNYFNTGWTNSNTNGGTLFAYCKTDPSPSGSGLMNIMGARNPNFICLVRTTAVLAAGINNGQWAGYVLPVVTNTGPISYCASRVSETASAVYYNGSLTAIVTSTNAPAGLQLGSLWLFDCNGSASQRGQWRGKAQAFGFGTNGVSAAQYKVLHDAVVAFNTRMGR